MTWAGARVTAAGTIRAANAQHFHAPRRAGIRPPVRPGVTSAGILIGPPCQIARGGEHSAGPGGACPPPSAARDEVEAEELCQEFALRFLRGDFRHADPDRGRFRDYLKVALRHLAGERSRRPRPLPLSGDRSVPPPDPVADVERFQQFWRAELLNPAWAALAERSAAPGG